MKHRIFLLAGLGLMGCASFAQAEPVTLDAAQLDHVAAGLSPPDYHILSSYNSVGAAALASSSAVSTPTGTAVANVTVTTSVGLANPGFSSAINTTVLH